MEGLLKALNLLQLQLDLREVIVMSADSQHKRRRLNIKLLVVVNNNNPLYKRQHPVKRNSRRVNSQLWEDFNREPDNIKLRDQQDSKVRVRLRVCREEDTSVSLPGVKHILNKVSHSVLIKIALITSVTFL